MTRTHLVDQAGTVDVDGPVGSDGMPGSDVTEGSDEAVASAGTSPASRSPLLVVRVARRAALLLIRVYQLARTGRPSPCRYWPTCSAYAAEAIERHGLRHGGWLAARRLARCHPWGGHGVDPVPD